MKQETEKTPEVRIQEYKWEFCPTCGEQMNREDCYCARCGRNPKTGQRSNSAEKCLSDLRRNDIDEDTFSRILDELTRGGEETFPLTNS